MSEQVAETRDTAGNTAGDRAVEHSARTCDGALARAFGFLGKRWNGILLATLTYGPTGFSDLRRNTGGISDSVLADRLGELSRAGLVTRTVHDGPPVAVVYELTASGRALAPALAELTRWARDNLTEERCRGER